MLLLTDGKLFPNKISSNCPAIIFAVRRTGSVAGRIRLLIVSMIIINVINIADVYYGTNCLNIWLVFLIHQNNMNLTHRSRATVSASVRCLIQELISRVMLQQFL